MRVYTADKYSRLVEKMDDPVFQEYEKAELDLIRQIDDLKSKTLIDLGAGYGRVLTSVAPLARNFISIELNPGMLSGLKARTAQHPNAIVIEGDIQNLSQLLKGQDMHNPVLLILQNTLGTIEGGYRKVLSEMKVVAKRYSGEVVVSLLRQEALKSWGVPSFYAKCREMVGEPDLEKTDLEKGLFVSKTGYTSKWWSAREVEELKRFFGGTLVKEVKTPYYTILHIKL